MKAIRTLLAIILMQTILTAQTNFAIGPAASPAATNVPRAGINIDYITNYGPLQNKRQLLWLNGNFEPMTWNTIIQCQSWTATTCTDSNAYNVFTANFMQGATFEVVSLGASNQLAGTVVSNTAGGCVGGGACGGPNGIFTLSTLSTVPSANDYLVMRSNHPSIFDATGAPAGWQMTLSGGATVGQETSDLPPGGHGTTALQINASSGSVALTNLMDAPYTGQSRWINVKNLTVCYQAKIFSGATGSVSIVLQRQGVGNYLSTTDTMTTSWANYCHTITPNETTATGGTGLALSGTFSGNLYVKNITNTEAATGSNTSAYRDSAVSALSTWYGTNNAGSPMRAMDSFSGLGNNMIDIINFYDGRRRAGWSTTTVNLTQYSVHQGAQEFFQLALQEGVTRPQFVIPLSASTADMTLLVDYLAGGSGTTGGALRIAQGQTAPWTSVFSTIDIELGDEPFGTFPGQTMSDDFRLGVWANERFGAAKTEMTSLGVANIKFAVDFQEVTPGNVTALTGNCPNCDIVTPASYLAYGLTDLSSDDSIHLPAFADEQYITSPTDPTGKDQNWIQQMKATIAGTGKAFGIYEEFDAPGSGAATQAQVWQYTQDEGMGVALAEKILLQIKNQQPLFQDVFALPEYDNSWTGANASVAPYWGVQFEFDGPAGNKPRPLFYAGQTVNQAIYPNLLTMTATGTNPTYSQAATSTNLNSQFVWTGNWTTNDLLAFPFYDGTSKCSIAMVNVSTATSYPITVSGTDCTPTGTVTQTLYTSTNVSDCNEFTNCSTNVAVPAVTTLTNPTGATLGPHSVTVWQWNKAVPPAGAPTARGGTTLVGGASTIQ